MPRATVDVEGVEKIDLKTCSGGFVTLRRMTYGQILHRRSMLKLSVTASKGSKNLEGEMALADKKVQIFEFGACIVDHNLEDAEGRKLNLGSSADVEKLDPQIGQEIEHLIEERNNFDGEDESEGN